jgi:hypothetical protein
MVETSISTQKEIKAVATFPPCLTFDLYSTAIKAVATLEHQYGQLRNALKEEKNIEVFHEPVRTYLSPQTKVLSYRMKVYVRFTDGSAEFGKIKEIILKFVSPYFKML